MKWLSKAWPALWDVGIFATGIVTAWTELAVWAILGRTPDTGLLALAAACLFPAARKSVKAVLGTGSSSESSRQPSPPSSSSSPPPEVGAGEQHG